MTTHQSDSAVQRDAERAIVDALAAELGVVLLPGGTLALSGGARIQLDARSEDGKLKRPRFSAAPIRVPALG